MKRLYHVLAGGSRVTPVGIAAAIAVAVAFRQAGWPVAPVYLAILLATLAASTFEPIQ